MATPTIQRRTVTGLLGACAAGVRWGVMMSDNAISIRPLDASDITVLVDAPWPTHPAERYRGRLERQERDEALYLVAWRDAAPLSHLMLVWAGPTVEPVASAVAGCAEIQDFVVHPALRSRGLGGTMLAHAVALARRHGFARLGLFVGVDNPRAHVFYVRHGFCATPFGPLTIGWETSSPDGTRTWHEERALYLLKELVA